MMMRHGGAGVERGVRSVKDVLQLYVCDWDYVRVFIWISEFIEHLGDIGIDTIPKILSSFLNPIGSQGPRVQLHHQKRKTCPQYHNPFLQRTGPWLIWKWKLWVGEHSDSTYLRIYIYTYIIYIYSIYIPKLYLGLINFLGSMRRHIFGRLVVFFPNSTRNLPWSLWRICGDVWNTGNATTHLVWPKTPWDRYGRILESPSPKKNENNAVICCLNLFLLCTRLPILKCETSCGGYTLTETNISPLKIGRVPKRICIFQTTKNCSCYCLMRFWNPKQHQTTTWDNAKTLVNHGDFQLPNSINWWVCRISVQIHRAESSGRGSKLRLVGKISGQKLKMKLGVSYG